MWSDTIAATLKPIWTLSSLFGLRSCSLNEKIKKPDEHSVFGKLFRWFYILLTICVTSFLAYKNCYVKILPGINIVIQLADSLYNITNNITMLVMVIMLIFYQSRLVSVVYRLDEIEKKLKSLYKWRAYTYVKTFIVSEILFTLGIWLIFFVTYVIVQCSESDATQCFWNWFIIFTSTKITQVVLVEFCAFTIVLRHMLKVINENLNEFLKQQMKSTTNLFYETTQREIEKIYYEIMTACRELQSIFSVPLLMKIGNQFLDIFSSLYFCVFGYMYNGQLVHPRNFFDVAIPFTTILIAIVEIFTMVTVCELTVLEFQSTGKLIYKIPMFRNNVMLMKRIDLFSLQLIHTNFHFTAAGFFRINGSLFQTIIGAATVYLVIFVQFDMATNKSNK